VRVLWVKASKLLPVDTGGKIRSFNILKRLGRDHELTLISYYGGRRDAEYETALPQHFPNRTSSGPALQMLRDFAAFLTTSIVCRV
jgi:hypothetical protein